jgi:tyrosyl-tRNA synthetase
MQTPSPKPAISANILAEAKRQHAILAHGTAAVYPEKGVHGPDGLFDKLVLALREKRPLKVKFGMDPTAPDLHLGHALILRKLREFQDLGHVIQPLIGDYTTRIGDPSGRNATRPPLDDAQIEANAKTYFAQVFKIVRDDPATLDLHYNSEWLSKLSFADTIQLCAQVTVAQLIAREDFAKRLANQTPIAMHELLYPIMQGYDSIGLMCDIELGGTDQTFNCLMGRQLMQARELVPQIVMTFPLLEGLDGVDKMSKSKGNYIGIMESAEQMFGKTMSIPDHIMGRWFDLLTTVPPQARPAHPMDAKKLLARTITGQFHDDAAAAEAQAGFEARFSKGELDESKIARVALKGESRALVDVLVALGFAASKSEARRLLEQGGVRVAGEVVKDGALVVPANALIQVGKLKIARVN